ncbi:hypothetical protein [uncultured Brevundimonas sp.]|uniref:hypothetical protein n=1 Tax=uncultured Brevundimonas sp. TaxID=213418 RepID=UPI0025CF0F9E|nr:hypothetical protein [uncultured Brevundimonas sp.]
MTGVGYALFCDEIRQEINGKYIVLGMFTGDMLISRFPTTQKLSALVYLSEVVAGDHDFEFVSSEGVSFGKLSLDMQPEPNVKPPFFIPLPAAVLTLSQSTEILLRYKAPNAEDWATLGEIGISLSPGPIPNLFGSEAL